MSLLENPPKCPICNEIIKLNITPEEWMHGCKDILSSTPDCNICKSRISRNRIEHIRQKHPNYEYCSICNSYTPNTLSDHVKRKHPNYEYCSICNSYTPNTLSDHIRRVHSKN